MIQIVCQTEGPVAQLGARMTGSHEVESSNLSRSTSQSLEDVSPSPLLQMQ